jgi:hypothetical protein
MTLSMARGWESKGIESQQADRESRESAVRTHLTPEQTAVEARRRTLELARARASADLKGARNPSHRATLEAAIAAIDEQIRRLP